MYILLASCEFLYRSITALSTKPTFYLENSSTFKKKNILPISCPDEG